MLTAVTILGAVVLYAQASAPTPNHATAEALNRCAQALLGIHPELCPTETPTPTATPVPPTATPASTATPEPATDTPVPTPTATATLEPCLVRTDDGALVLVENDAPVPCPVEASVVVEPAPPVASAPTEVPADVPLPPAPVVIYVPVQQPPQIVYVYSTVETIVYTTPVPAEPTYTPAPTDTPRPTATDTPTRTATPGDTLTPERETPAAIATAVIPDEPVAQSVPPELESDAPPAEAPAEIPTVPVAPRPQPITGPEPRFALPWRQYENDLEDIQAAPGTPDGRAGWWSRRLRIAA